MYLANGGVQLVFSFLLGLGFAGIRFVRVEEFVIWVRLSRTTVDM